ncbi:MAG: hypothetical protein QXL35_06020 [Candidatus Bathyarchaeia archaeon]
MRAEYGPITWLGIALIAIGAALLLIPHLAERMPELGRLPPILFYVYRRGDFYLATSPILIAISLLALLAILLARRA